MHQEHREAYGALKTWFALKERGIACGKHRVARLRQAAGIEAKRKRRFRVITEHHRTPQAAPDLLGRRFNAPVPNAVWVGDMTFVRTREGFLHLAVLLDLYSRRVVGWAMDTQPSQALGQAALAMALDQRKPRPGLIHHTDRGSPYSARAYPEQLHARGICRSMSGRKSAYDNAVAESFFSNLKNEPRPPLRLPDAGPRAGGDLRLHRALLQPKAHPPIARLSHARGSRARMGGCLTNVSGEGGTAHSDPFSRRLFPVPCYGPIRGIRRTGVSPISHRLVPVTVVSRGFHQTDFALLGYLGIGI